MVLTLSSTFWHCFWYSLSHYVCVTWSWRTCNLCIRVCLQIWVWHGGCGQRWRDAPRAPSPIPLGYPINKQLIQFGVPLGEELVDFIKEELGGRRNGCRACLGISGMNENEGHWSGGISTISQNFPQSPSILFHPLESSISQRGRRGIHDARVSMVNLACRIW
jgi:hypothetical protein